MSEGKGTAEVLNVKGGSEVFGGVSCCKSYLFCKNNLMYFKNLNFKKQQFCRGSEQEVFLCL